MAISAFVICISAFVLFLVGAVVYVGMLLSHIEMTLQKLSPIPGGGYELVPSMDNIGKVVPHIIIIAALVIFAAVLLILLIKRKTAAVTLAASVIVIIAAYLLTDTQTAEFTFIKSTLGIKGAAETFEIFKFIPFALSAIAAAVSLILDKIAKIKNA